MKVLRQLSCKVLLSAIMLISCCSPLWADEVTTVIPKQDARDFVNNTVNNVLDVLQKNQSNLATNCPAMVTELGQKINLCIQDIVNFVAPAHLLKSASQDDISVAKTVIMNYLIGSYYNVFVTGPLNTLKVRTYPVRGDAFAKMVQVNMLIDTDPSSTDPGSKIPVSVIVKRTDSGWCIGDLVLDGNDQLLSVRSQMANIQATTLTQLSDYVEQHNAAQCKQQGS